ncbi:hypothetical protein F5887DRAFT_1083305 [Amanita rubescens]|nr:hypothetical protein F5887DRAFT_1083305 [Amanita rubescens]
MKEMTPPPQNTASESILDIVQRHNQVKIIANDQGNRVTPSWVGFMERNDCMVNDSAKNAFHSNTRTKRLIGRCMDDDIKKDMKHQP